MALVRRSAALSVSDVLAEQRVDQGFGLSQDDAEIRRREHGSNILDQDEKEPLWKKFLEQFKDPLIGLLFASAFVSVLVKQV